MDKFCDFFDYCCFVYLVGNFCDDNGLVAVVDFFEIGFGMYDDGVMAGLDGVVCIGVVKD